MNELISVKRENFKNLMNSAQHSFIKASRHLAKSQIHSLRAAYIQDPEMLRRLSPENIGGVSFSQTVTVKHTITVNLNDGDTLSKEVVAYEQ